MKRETILLIVPAYGRQYTDEEEALEDWIKGRDFKIPNGRYLSVRDAARLREAGYTLVRMIFRFPTGHQFVDWKLPPKVDPGERPTEYEINRKAANAIPQD